MISRSCAHGNYNYLCMRRGYAVDGQAPLKNVHGCFAELVARRRVDFQRRVRFRITDYIDSPVSFCIKPADFSLLAVLEI